MVRNVADVVQPCENRQDEGMTCLRAMYRKGGPMRRLLNALVAALLCCTVMSATRAAPGEERRTLPFAFSVTKRGEGNFFRGDYIDYPLSQVAVKGEVWSFHTIAAYANPTPIVRYKGPDFEHLGAIDTALMWEFGPAIREKGIGSSLRRSRGETCPAWSDASWVWHRGWMVGSSTPTARPRTSTWPNRQ